LLWLIATLSGALAELAQGYLTATRSMEWLDLMANGGGALIGIIIGVSWCRLVAPSESGVEN
jgi:VanZ family protein